MDEQVKVLKHCAEEAWFLYQACLRMAKALETADEDATKKDMQIHTVKLNSQIASTLLSIESIVDAGILSHESIESVLMTKQQEITNKLLKEEK